MAAERAPEMHDESVDSGVPHTPAVTPRIILRRLRSPSVSLKQLLPLTDQCDCVFLSYQGGWWFLPPTVLNEAVRINGILIRFMSYLADSSEPWPTVEIDGSLERFIAVDPYILECLTDGLSKRLDDIPYLGDGQSDANAETD